MNPLRGQYLILIGFVMMLLGVILPLLMVLKILESTFFLNFFSYGMQVAGLFLGIIGSAFYVSVRRKKSKDISGSPEMPPYNDHQDW